MNNDSFMESLLARAEEALLSVKKAEDYIPDDISKAREIVRMYEGCASDLMFKLWSLITTSPSKTDDNKELAHWQGMIDAYVGILLRFYQAKKFLEKQDNKE